MSFFWAARVGASFAAASDAAEAKGDAKKAQRSATEIEAKLDRSLLACEAMWTLLRDKLGMTDVDLLKRINEIDLSDGKLDGKVRRSAVGCPSCGRTIARRFPKCMYCGQAIMHDPFG